MMTRPRVAVVQRERTGQSAQWVPKRAEPDLVIVTVMSSGQVTVRASRPMVEFRGCSRPPQRGVAAGA